MKAIIYVYIQRTIPEPAFEKIIMNQQEEPYCLIKVALPDLRHSCQKNFPENQLAEPENGAESAQLSGPKKSVRKRIRYGFFRRRKEQKPSPEKESEREDTEVATAAECLAGTVTEKIKEMLPDMEDTDCSVVYEDSFHEFGAGFPCFPYARFRGFREMFWSQQLMEYGARGDYHIVGYAPCVKDLLCKYARKIKSVQWTLSEALCNANLKDFVEDYYEEYGILIALRTCPPTMSLKCAGPVSIRPVTVLDFSGAERTPAWGVCEGSVWLDMDSDEEKEIKIETQNPGISYFSLKKIWKQAQKGFDDLDTSEKSGYNV